MPRDKPVDDRPKLSDTAAIASRPLPGPYLHTAPFGGNLASERCAEAAVVKGGSYNSGRFAKNTNAGEECGKGVKDELC